MFQRKNLMDLVSGLEDKLTLTIGGDVAIITLKITTNYQLGEGNNQAFSFLC